MVELTRALRVGRGVWGGGGGARLGEGSWNPEMLVGKPAPPRDLPAYVCSQDEQGEVKPTAVCQREEKGDEERSEWTEEGK